MLKKISAVITGFFILFSLSSCEKSDSETESSSKYGKEDIIGEWYSGEIGGSFYFDENNNFSLRIDVTDVMYIDSEGISHIAGSDDDYSDYCNYDGETYTFNINSIDMLTMTRKEKSDSDSVYGKYILKSGILYDELSDKYEKIDDRYNIIVSENILTAEINMCEYSVDNGVIIFSGNDLEIFDAGENKDTKFNFAVQSDVLTLVQGEERLVFSKISD